MTEEQLRAIVREVVARHLGTPAQGPASPGPVMAAGRLPEGPVWKGHASHVRLSLQTFMRMLGERFPGTQFLITGLLGPQSNAHGPNEFLQVATGKRLTACVARVLADHAVRS